MVVVCFVLKVAPAMAVDRCCLLLVATLVVEGCLDSDGTWFRQSYPNSWHFWHRFRLCGLRSLSLS